MIRAALLSLVVPLLAMTAAAAPSREALPDFDQGVDAKAVLRTVKERTQDPAMDKALEQSGFIAAGLWNRCQAMGLEQGQCLYVCRDGRRILMPIPDGMERMGSRACLQFIEAPPLPPAPRAEKPEAKAVKTEEPKPEEPPMTCEEKCYQSYRRSVDFCYELFDNPAGLRPCLHDAAMGYNYCKKACEKPKE